MDWFKIAECLSEHILKDHGLADQMSFIFKFPIEKTVSQKNIFLSTREKTSKNYEIHYIHTRKGANTSSFLLVDQRNIKI